MLADALAQTPRPTHLITEGGIQSNHVRQVAAAAAKLGLKAALVAKDLVPERTSNSDSIKAKAYTDLGNVQLTHLMSAIHTNSSADVGEELLDGGTGYHIPSGASTHPLGGLGYARWAFEITEYEREHGELFNAVVVATMSGSTLAGIVAGLKLADKLSSAAGKPVPQRQIVGVAAGPADNDDIGELVLRIAKTTAEKIGLSEAELTRADFSVDARWHGGSYGRLDDQTKTNIKLAASMEGLITDPVYSGKALTGMCEMVRAGELWGNILFVHTGGVCSISAYPDLR